MKFDVLHYYIIKFNAIIFNQTLEWRCMQYFYELVKQ